jgi:hypothetical protein
VNLVYVFFDGGVTQFILNTIPSELAAFISSAAFPLLKVI